MPTEHNRSDRFGAAKHLVAGALSTVFLTTAASAWAMEAVPPGSPIVAQEHPLGTIFLNAAGMPLYIYDPDKKSGKSTCNDKCAAAWPPLIAAADAQPTGPWTLAVREDGTKQWAYEGSPLYTYAKDTLPGLATGEGLQDIWHRALKLAPRPLDVTYRGTATGRVAADLKGMTLYSSDRDTAGGEACMAACLQQWEPMHAPGAAVAIGDWSIIERKDDGEPQWAYKGKPVYRYSGDLKPGEVSGEGTDRKWHALVMDPAPAAPNWITIQQSEFGPIFANAKCQTLYTLTADIETIKKISCDEACLKENFTAVLADGNESAQLPAGSNWGVLKNPEGQMQWSFRGKFVYTFNQDKLPSEIKATAFGSNGLGSTWLPIPVSSGFMPVL